MSLIKLDESKSQVVFDMVRDCVERGMVESDSASLDIYKLILQITNNLINDLPKVKITIEVLD